MIREVECNNTFQNIHICCFLCFFLQFFSQALRSSRPKIIVTLAIFRADLSKSDLSFRIYSIKVRENVPYVEFSIPCKRNELHFHASGVSQIPGCCPMCPIDACSFSWASQPTSVFPSPCPQLLPKQNPLPFGTTFSYE